MQVSYPGFAGGARTDIALPASQERLLKALHATGTPVVLASGHTSRGGGGSWDAHDSGRSSGDTDGAAGVRTASAVASAVARRSARSRATKPIDSWLSALAYRDIGRTSGIDITSRSR